MTPPLLSPKKRIALLKALASPARIEVVEVMQISGPATVAEISTQLGRAPDSLYHHLKQLEKAGIVERQGTKLSGGRSGAVYALCGREVGAESNDESTSDERAAMADLGGAILRLSERDMRSALTVDWPPSTDFEGMAEFPFVQRTKAWLTPDEAQQLNAKVGELLDFMSARAVRKSGTGSIDEAKRLFALTQVLSPVPTRSTRASSTAEISETP
jgi:DNA-binding transcriptional ArsR family regulator